MADVQVEYRRDAASVRRILESLPEWFGDPEAIGNYAEAADDTAFESLVAFDADAPSRETVAVALVRRHFAEAAELHLIAVHPDWRGRGAGRALLERIAADLTSDGCRLLSVHTVGPSFPHDGYAATRAFYVRAGFMPLEEHDGLDWSGPTLILVRPLG